MGAEIPVRNPGILKGRFVSEISSHSFLLSSSHATDPQWVFIEGNNEMKTGKRDLLKDDYKSRHSILPGKDQQPKRSPGFGGLPPLGGCG